VKGEAKVEVLRGPFVAVVPASVTLYASPGAAVAPQVVAVSNGGGGRLEQLATGVTYVSGADGWLDPTLTSATAPTSLTLRIDPAGLAAGTHRATVAVSSVGEADPAQVDVVLNVAGFEVREIGPGTSVAESGTTAEIGVMLSSPPSAPVVLNVTTSDPTEVIVSPTSLRFGTDNWDREQSITVRGADDIDDDGDQVSTVSVTVDGAQSPDAFDVLPARTVSVTTVDDDDTPSLVVLESGGTTVVRETSTRDDFTVALATPIVSNVVLEITTSDPGEVGVVSTRYLTFTPVDWNVPQTVTVIGIPDFWRDGDQWATITIRVLDFYSDDRYDTLFETLQVLNEDAGLIG
jgi:hypothetical protein